MDSPPEKKFKAEPADLSGLSEDGETSYDEEDAVSKCTTVSIVVGKGDCLSPVVRISGYPWRLRLHKKEDGKHELFVRCEKSMETELWECNAQTLLMEPVRSNNFHFGSMYKNSQEKKICQDKFAEGTQLEVEIDPSDDGDNISYICLMIYFFMWKVRPTVGHLDPRDGCLLIEDKKMYVNKQSLASQSPFFDRLFNAELREKNMDEIPLGEVGAEEFSNLMKMLYGVNGASVVADLLTHDNVHRVLELADRFELKIVEEGVFNVLLSRNSAFSIHERLLIADVRGLACKDRIILSYLNFELVELSNAPEYGQLTSDTKEALFRKSCGALTKAEEKIAMDLPGSSEEMAGPQAEEECTTILMVVDKRYCLSPVYRIKGYPWRLRVYERSDGNCELLVRCEKSMEAELWECEAVVTYNNERKRLVAFGTFKFTSMNKMSQERCLCTHQMFSKGTKLDIEIKPSDNGDKARPIVGLLLPRDGCLMIEDKPMYVNKQSLASQSPFFDRLFNADFKEKNMDEIPIRDVGYEDFNNLMDMVYGVNGASVVGDLLTKDNVDRILQLVDRFELKIVEDGIFNTLLSDDYSFSIHERLLIAEQNNLECKERVISLYTNIELTELCDAPEYDQLSLDTKDVMYRKTCNAFARALQDN